MISFIKHNKYFIVNNSKAVYSNRLSCFKRTLHEKPLKGKIVGRTKHYPPAVNEWKDSGYFYNKHYMKLLPTKYNITDKYIKGFLNVTGIKEAARSKRMRSKIVRFSTKKLFISKPEIKHSSDKAAITVYIFNREKQFYVRKLFFYKRKPSMYNTWLLNRMSKKTKLENVKFKRNIMFKNKMKRSIPYYGIKFNNELDFLRYKLLNLSKNLIYINQFLMFLFLSNLLCMFNIKIYNPLIHERRTFINDTLNKVPNWLFWLDKRASKLNIIYKDNINVKLLKKVLETRHKNCRVKDLGLLNNYLWKFINDNYLVTGLLKNKHINFLYKVFMYNKSRKVISVFFKKEAKLFFNHGKLQINKMKFTNLLFGLKKFISKIYNKTTYLNIVNLKYLHLNSDIFTQAVALKLRKKRSFLKILRKSLKLVKVPFQYFYREKKLMLNRFLDLNRFKSLNLNRLTLENTNKLGSNDKIDGLFKKIFPVKTSMVHKTGLDVINKNQNEKLLTVKNKGSNILESIKFKWVSGLRLEAAGRLTRRNTASRSSFKLMYKGNLKSKQYYIEHDLLKTMPTITLRNNSKVNTQYTLTKSKRRIGSFGVKSWISSY